jgi:hypothetical protein
VNDDEACIAILRPMRDHFLLTGWYHEQRDALGAGKPGLDVGHLAVVLERPELSSGEAALIEIALAIRNWQPVNVITRFGSMSRSWQHHVLAILVTRFGLSPSHAGDGLAWVDAYDEGEA